MAKKAIHKKPETQVALQPVDIPPPVNAGEIPGVYANMFEMLSMNNIDVRFAFNEVSFETGGAMRTLRRANIVMPTQAFLAMIQILNANTQVLLSNAQSSAAMAQARM